MRMLDRYRLSKNDVNRIGLVKARSEYKAILRKCRYEYDRERTSRFVNARYKDARLYWNLLKESAGIKSTSVPLSSLNNTFVRLITRKIDFITRMRMLYTLMSAMKETNSQSCLKN